MTRTCVTGVVAGMAALAVVGCGSDHPTVAGELPAGVLASQTAMRAEVAAEGGRVRVGEWDVGYIVEAPEGWFEPRGDRLAWRAPAADETHHIEILPIEAETGRLVPDVPITVEILTPERRLVDRRRLAFYHGEFFHYAENFSVPEDGTYTLRVTLDAPKFRRHGEVDGDPPLSEGTVVQFDKVVLERSEP